MNNFMSKYIVGEDFDIAALINDDFVIAMKMLWNGKQYSSNLKLLLCFIDTISYVSTGNSNPNSFMNWLKKYVDLKKIGVTENELWEHRNAVLHLSTYESVKIKNGKIKKLIPCCGKIIPTSSTDCVYYSLYDLQIEILNGVGRYLAEMNEHEQMRKIFSENYAKTISDLHFS